MLQQVEILNQHELAGVFGGLNFNSARLCHAKKPARFADPGGRNTLVQGPLPLQPRIDGGSAHYRANLPGGERRSSRTEHAIGLVRAGRGLAAASPDETVYDPACGTGKMLFHCASLAAKEGHQKTRLFGAERNRTAWTLAKINALFHGFSSERIELCDALEPANVPQSAGCQLKFDVVVCHPPWGVKEWRDDKPAAERYDRFRRGMPPKNNADYAYLLHMVSSLKEDSGRMAAVVAGGVLSRGGQEGRIRQRLLKDNLVDSVIGLPDKMFQGTPVGGAILIMRRDRSRRDILFIDARNLASVTAGKNTFSHDALNLIRHAFSVRTNQAGLAKVASWEDIVESLLTERVAVCPHRAGKHRYRCIGNSRPP